MDSDVVLLSCRFAELPYPCTSLSIGRFFVCNFIGTSNRIGRDNVNVPRHHREWQDGATASVLDHRGKCVGTTSLGQMPESGQKTLTAQVTALLQVNIQGLRLVYSSGAGYHSSDDCDNMWQKLTQRNRPLILFL